MIFISRRDAKSHNVTRKVTGISVIELFAWHVRNSNVSSMGGTTMTAKELKLDYFQIYDVANREATGNGNRVVSEVVPSI